MFLVWKAISFILFQEETHDFNVNKPGCGLLSNNLSHIILILAADLMHTVSENRLKERWKIKIYGVLFLLNKMLQIFLSLTKYLIALF